MGFLSKISATEVTMSYLAKIKFLQQNSMIVAGPERINPMKVRYNDIDENQKLYAEQSKSKGEVIFPIAPGIKLYLKGNKLTAFDDNDKLILYTMTFETHKIFGYDFAVQSFVWASPKLEAYKIGNESVPTYVFFNILMRTTGGVAIATDAFHTPDGERFWLRRVNQALRLKQFVYLIDTTKGQKVKVKDYIDFQHKIKEMKIWDEKGQGADDRRVVISSKLLW